MTYLLEKYLSSRLEFHPDDSVNTESGEVGPQVEVVHDGTDEYRKSDIVPGEYLAVGSDGNDVFLWFVHSILCQVGEDTL